MLKTCTRQIMMLDLFMSLYIVVYRPNRESLTILFITVMVILKI